MRIPAGELIPLAAGAGGGGVLIFLVVIALISDSGAQERANRDLLRNRSEFAEVMVARANGSAAQDDVGTERVLVGSWKTDQPGVSMELRSDNTATALGLSAGVPVEGHWLVHQGRFMTNFRNPECTPAPEGPPDVCNMVSKFKFSIGEDGIVELWGPYHFRMARTR